MTRAETGPDASAEEVKACCAAAYEGDAVALLLGEHYHPGGVELTRRLARTLGLRPGHRVLDVASGRGSTALLLAREFGASVDGVDFGGGSVVAAEQAVNEAGLADAVRFTRGDAEKLPFDGGGFDAVVCECALCTFPDKPAAVGEFARVLAPGGRVGLTDVTVRPESLVGELRTVAGWVSCLAGARPAAGYADLLAGAGLRTTVTEHHDQTLAGMVEQIEARLGALRMMAGRMPALADVDFDRALELTGKAQRAVADGSAGYALLVAEKAA